MTTPIDPHVFRDDPIGQSQDELFDVVDADDRVIGRATRRHVHAEGLMHRAVHCWVVRTDGSLVLQMRSRHKDICPLTWTSSASGHVDAGESYRQAVVRELQEELGLPVAVADRVELLHTYAACLELGNEHTQLFKLVTDAAMDPDPAEVAYLEQRPLPEWLAEIDRQPATFSSSVAMMLQQDGHRLQQ